MTEFVALSGASKYDPTKRRESCPMNARHDGLSYEVTLWIRQEPGDRDLHGATMLVVFIAR